MEAQAMREAAERNNTTIPAIDLAISNAVQKGLFLIHVPRKMIDSKVRDYYTSRGFAVYFSEDTGQELMDRYWIVGWKIITD